MNGPEHYQRAEHCMEQSLDFRNGSDEHQAKIAEAQVHATLAQAAATVLNAMVLDENKGEAYFDGDMEDWRHALDGTEPQP